jgi:hypothetical protein
MYFKDFYKNKDRFQHVRTLDDSVACIVLETTTSRYRFNTSSLFHSI